MRRKRITILLTGAGTATTISVIKGIRQQKEFEVRIVTCDRNDNVSGHYMSDRFYKIPSAEDPAFLPALLRIVKKERVNMIIPIVDYEFKTFTDNRAKFKKLGTTLVLSNPNVIDTCINKFKTMRFFESINLAHPKSYTLARAKHTRLHYPLFMKPSVFGRATIDAYMINDKKDLLFYATKVHHPIIQEFINGTEITVDALNDFSGKFVSAVARIRTETKSGLSIKGVVIRDDTLMTCIKRITEALPIIGPCNIQCFKTNKGLPAGRQGYIFSEINPRFAGAQTLSIQAGLNSIHLLCKLYRDEKINPESMKIRFQTRMIRYWEEIFLTPDGKPYEAKYRLVK